MATVLEQRVRDLDEKALRVYSLLSDVSKWEEKQEYRLESVATWSHGLEYGALMGVLDQLELAGKVRVDWKATGKSTVWVY